MFKPAVANWWSERSEKLATLATAGLNSDLMLGLRDRNSISSIVVKNPNYKFKAEICLKRESLLMVLYEKHFSYNNKYIAVSQYSFRM